jgi:outer membrane protein insertion porin family
MNYIIYNKVKKSLKTNRLLLLVAFFTLHSSLSTLMAQDVIVNPDISYAGTPRQCEIGGLTVKGVEGYEDYVLLGLSGLSVGQTIDVPGTEITEAIKRYWRNGLF